MVPFLLRLFIGLFCMHSIVAQNFVTPCPNKTEAFFQVNHVPNEDTHGRIVLPAKDGSIYVAGFNGSPDSINNLTILRFKDNGELLWSRRFDFAKDLLIQQLIEDSEGYLVGAMSQTSNTTNQPSFVVFRYNPDIDKLLWIKRLAIESNSPFPHVLAEKKTGGNYVVCYWLNQNSTELCELNRVNGSVIAGRTYDYGLGVGMYNGEVRQDVLYLNGFINVLPASRLNGFMKIDLNTGSVLEKKGLRHASDKSVPSGPSTLDDDKNMVSLLQHNNMNMAVWMLKTNENGVPLWHKRFVSSSLSKHFIRGASVVSVTDGYVALFEIYDLNAFGFKLGILKTDKNGNLIWSNYFNPGYQVASGFRSQCMKSRKDKVFLTCSYEEPGQTTAKNKGVLLLKLDKDGRAGENCNLLTPLPMSQMDEMLVELPAVVNKNELTRKEQLIPPGHSNNFNSETRLICSRCAPSCDQLLDLGPDLFICSGDSILLKTNDDFETYKWQDGSTGQQFWAKQPGKYFVEVMDKCGDIHSDTVYISPQTPPLREELVVLLPGESISIGGKTYTQPAKTSIIIPSKTGTCDTTVNYTIVVSPGACKAPKSFLKSYAGSIGTVIKATEDGNVFILGETLTSTTLTKFDSTGKLLWAGEIIKNIAGPGTYVRPASMIEDSEGMLVVYGIHSNTLQPVAFRYNPVTHQLLWLRIIQDNTSFLLGTVQNIIEEKKGGDYILITEVNEFSSLFQKSDVIRLSRSTGAFTAATRYAASQFMNIQIRDQALYVAASFQDSTNQNKVSSGIVKIDLTTNNVLWAKKLNQLWPNGNGGREIIFDTDGNQVALLAKPNEFILQKNSPDGTLIWQRTYQRPDNFNSLASNIRLLDDGDYVLTLTGNNTTNSSLILAKISKDGPVKWAKFVKNLRLLGSFKKQWLDVHKNTIYFAFGGTESNNTLFGKFNASGEMSPACQLTEDIMITYAPSAIEEIALSLKSEQRNKVLVTANTDNPTILNYDVKFRCVKCVNVCDTIRTFQYLTFYKGDTVLIGGNPYTMSDTVVQFWLTNTGCDSVSTTILTQISSKIDIKCPSDISVTLPPNATVTKVDYNLPLVTANDCPNPQTTLKRLQGPTVTGDFKQGITKVCYEVSNACKAADTCCFNVTVLNPETPCDIKTGPNCIRYELLTLKFDENGQRRYRIRLSNTCTAAVQFIYIETPGGVNAVSPAGGSVFTASPSGRLYDVRNPNAAPFASLRFKAQSNGLKSGASDIFDYSLPQQSAPNYILVGTRLENGDYYEAYLNTFNCPVQPYDGNKNRENEAPYEPSPLRRSFSIFPNPANDILYVNFSQVEAMENVFGPDIAIEKGVKLLVVNALGQIVFQREYALSDTNDHPFSIVLNRNLADGLYTFKVVWPDGVSRSERFVLKR